MGDFNRFNFRILSNNFNLRQLVKAPTRGSATLDLILTNLFEHFSKPDILAGIGLSDHKSILIRPLMQVKREKSKVIYRRSVKPYMEVAFGRWLTSTDFTFLEALSSCSEKLDAFQSLLNYAIDLFFPLQKSKQHPNDKPWITLELRSLIQQRQQAMDKDPVAFRKLRNNVNRLNNRLRCSFFEKKVKNCDDASSWWKSLKQLSGSSSKKSVSCVIEADKEIKSTELANTINNRFLLANNSIPPLPLLHNDSALGNTEEIALKYQTSPEEVYKELAHLKRGEASGPDNLPTWILKEFAMELSSPVALIFNASIQERSVPNVWKLADVIPIPKTNPVKEIEKDLRPISLTAVLSKTMERFVVKWIMSQIRQLIDLNQFGSLPGLSTTHALLSLVHHLYKATDQRDQCVRVLLLDFSKAFDRINHNILLRKMRDMAIDPTLIEWVRSFLSNRKQRVRIGSSTSCYQQVNGGVPQGTVLGPILFMIMINDLLKDWESRWKYVDDTTLSETVIVNEESVLQCTLDGINLWCEENDMVLNTRKCKEILICFWKKKPNFQQLTVNNYPVEHVNSAKLLGVMLSSDLKWNEHVAYIVKKSSRRLYMLRLLKRANADKKR